MNLLFRLKKSTNNQKNQLNESSEGLNDNNENNNTNEKAKNTREITEDNNNNDDDNDNDNNDNNDYVNEDNNENNNSRKKSSSNSTSNSKQSKKKQNDGRKMKEEWGLPTLKVVDQNGKIITVNPEKPTPIESEYFKGVILIMLKCDGEFSKYNRYADHFGTKQRKFEVQFQVESILFTHLEIYFLIITFIFI